MRMISSRAFARLKLKPRRRWILSTVTMLKEPLAAAGTTLRTTKTRREGRRNARGPRRRNVKPRRSARNEEKRRRHRFGRRERRVRMRRKAKEDVRRRLRRTKVEK